MVFKKKSLVSSISSCDGDEIAGGTFLPININVTFIGFGYGVILQDVGQIIRSL